MAVRTHPQSWLSRDCKGWHWVEDLDPSHSLAALTKLYHAASKLGMNAETAFTQGAQFVPPGS